MRSGVSTGLSSRTLRQGSIEDFRVTRVLLLVSRLFHYPQEARRQPEQGKPVMPGPKHQSPRNPGNRLDPEGNPRKKNRKQAARLAARTAAAPLGPAFTAPGSQNRKK